MVAGLRRLDRIAGGGSLPRGWFRSSAEAMRVRGAVFGAHEDGSHFGRWKGLTIRTPSISRRSWRFPIARRCSPTASRRARPVHPRRRSRAGDEGRWPPERPRDQVAQLSNSARRPGCWRLDPLTRPSLSPPRPGRPRSDQVHQQSGEGALPLDREGEQGVEARLSSDHVAPPRGRPSPAIPLKGSLAR